jgi:NTE family protein
VWGRKKRLRINLALQGGGAHGAFTWGVLDRLLEEDDLEIGWISATSAGAVNAVAVASGLAEAGHLVARDKLKRLWEAVYKAGVPDFIRLNPFLYSLSRSGPVADMASLWSPYQFNPLGFDPLRKLLEEIIDFDALRARAPVELLIAATEVATGRARLFRRHEMRVEAVLASACLPTLHHAVEIDGKAYWDGGFSANPDLVTLGLESPVEDTLIVQLNPVTTRGLPTSVRDIAGQVNLVTFNAPFLRDVRLIEAVRASVPVMLGKPRGPYARLVRHRYHVIEAGRYTAGLAPETKARPDWGLFTYLHGAGRTETHKWLARTRSDVGRRETAELQRRYLSPATTVEAPIAQPAAGEATLPAATPDGRAG